MPASDPTCVFCKIVSKQIPASLIYEGEAVVAFLDINPLAEGHLLIVPRDHYTGLVDLPPSVSAAILSCVPKLGAALLNVAGAAGFNVLLNHGRVAGQVVPHVHCHLIPRKPMDELGYRWIAGKYPQGRDAEVAAAYRAALAEG